MNFRQSQKNKVEDIVWAEEIHEKDLFMCFDGNKMRNNNVMSKASTGMSESGQRVALPASKPKRLNIIYDFDTVVRRRSRQKEVVMAMQESQGIVINTSQKFQWNIVKRRWYSGTTEWAHMAFIALNDHDHPSVWRMGKDIKVDEIFTQDNVHGNPSGSYQKIDQAEKYSNPDNKEPVFWHHHPTILAKELIHHFNLKRLLHFSVGDGYWAIAGVILRVAGVYVALTEAHAKAVREHIIEEIFRLAQSQEEGNWLWDAEMVSAIAEYDAEVQKKNTASGDAEPKQSQPGGATGSKQAGGDTGSVKQKKKAQKSTRKKTKKNKRSSSSSSFSSYRSSGSGQWASDKDG